MGQAADGLFAKHHLGVEIVDPESGRGPDNILRVAEGERDFCLTSVHHYLTALSKAGGHLLARFVAVVVRHSPLAAIVSEDAGLVGTSELHRLRLAASSDKPHGAEFVAALRARGDEPPEVVPLGIEGTGSALANGNVDGLVGFIDALPRWRRLSGRPLRAVPVGLPVYASGLVAADRLSADVVGRMRTALVAALQSQRDSPDAGVTDLVARYPDIVAEEAVEGWRLIEPYIFGGGEAGTMNIDEWRETLAFLCAARGLSTPAAEQVHRIELSADSAVPRSSRAHTPSEP